MSRAAWVIYAITSFTGNVAIGAAVESFAWGFVGMLAWSLMLMTIISGVDESVRN